MNDFTSILCKVEFLQISIGNLHLEACQMGRDGRIIPDAILDYTQHYKLETKWQHMIRCDIIWTIQAQNLKSFNFYHFSRVDMRCILLHWGLKHAVLLVKYENFKVLNCSSLKSNFRNSKIVTNFKKSGNFFCSLQTFYWMRMDM